MDPSAGMKRMPVVSPGKAVVYVIMTSIALIIRYCIKKYRLLPTVLVLSIVMQVVAFVSVPSTVMFIRWRNSKKQTKTEPAYQKDPISFEWLPRRSTVASFLLVSVSTFIVQKFVDEIDVWRAGALLQCLAYLIVAMKVAFKKSVAGLSAGKFTLDVLSLTCRIAATWSSGFRMPRNSGSDFVKAVDICSLMLAAFVLSGVHVLFRQTYQVHSDAFRIREVVFGAAVLAVLLHVNIGHQFVPDTLWTFALYLDVVSMLPQFQMIGQNGGVVDQATNYHIVALAGSRWLGFSFWWMIQGHWFQGLSWTGRGIMVAYGAYLLLVSHYMCYFFKGLYVNGPFSFAPLLCADG
mmetsp:Transcript_57649/g.100904  ORF Transcript_57649/g.100904 Transcript_57649/m.100904 type:complete len:349 (+) Transcript_57649:94-1140(+)